MGRAPCCDKANVKKGPWSPEEDAKLKSYIEKHGMGGNWIALPQKIGLKRCGKSCRLRWLNYLRPNIKHGGFSEEEDKIILSLYVSIGSRWSIIAAQLPGRTDNDIKNYWNTRLKKKLFAKQRKDHQHSRGGSNLIIKQEGDYNLVHQNPWTYSILNYNQNPCYPQLPMPSTTSLPSYSNQGDAFHCLNDHTSIRKMLIKVGEHYDTTSPSFSYDNSYQSITQPNNLRQHINDTIHISSIPMDAIITSTTNTCQMQNPNHNHGDVVVGIELFGGQSTTFPAELEELMSSNPQRVDGLDFLYGDYGKNLVNNDGSTSDNTTTCGENSSRWGEMSSLTFFPNLDSECSNVILQGIGEGSRFEENVEFRPKL